MTFKKITRLLTLKVHSFSRSTMQLENRVTRCSPNSDLGRTRKSLGIPVQQATGPRSEGANQALHSNLPHVNFAKKLFILKKEKRSVLSLEFDLQKVFNSKEETKEAKIIC